MIYELIGLKDIAKRIDKQHKSAMRDLRQILVGKRIKINSDNYNGQPYGTSRPKMRGKSWVFGKNDFLYIDDGKIIVQPPNTNCSLTLDECIVSDDKPKGVGV